MFSVPLKTVPIVPAVQRVPIVSQQMSALKVTDRLDHSGYRYNNRELGLLKTQAEVRWPTGGHDKPKPGRLRRNQPDSFPDICSSTKPHITLKTFLILGSCRLHSLEDLESLAFEY
jgi:hypothetical protein